MTGRNRWLSAYALAGYVFLFLPIVVLIVFSFNDSRRNFQWRGFTLEWYPRLFANEELLDALSVTLRVATVAVIVSTVLGTLLGLALARSRFRGRGATETLLLVPMITPEIVMGLSLLVFFYQLFGVRGSFAQLSLAHITFCISYVAIVVRARAAGMDPRLEEAARDLGRVGHRGVPLRDAADHPACRGVGGTPGVRAVASTITSSARSMPASGRPRCRCTSTARSSSA